MRVFTNAYPEALRKIRSPAAHGKDPLMAASFRT